MFLVINGDKPIFEHNFLKYEKLQNYFIIHSALDTIDQMMQYRREFYLGQLRSDELPIFCLTNATGLRLFLVITGRKQFDKKSETAIKDFLIQANRNLAVALMNPLYKQKDDIRSPTFESKIVQLGQQFLRSVLEKRNTK